MPHSEEVKEALADAVALDAYVGKCPKCGKDLQIRVSQKTRGQFIGCAGWPECDVTFPLPQGKIESTENTCPVCGMPQVKVSPFRQKPFMHCIDPECASNHEPDLEVGLCPVCGEKGVDAMMIARKNPRTLKRYIMCSNFEACGTRYPLPARGELSATEEACEHCGAPMVVVTTSRGPWKLCPNYDCPGKAEAAEKKARLRAGMPVVNMWCTQSPKLKKPVAMSATTMPMR